VDRGGNEYDVAQQLGNTPEVARAVTCIRSARRAMSGTCATDGEGVVDLAAERNRRTA
jgi:hypothetical protein